jgi:chromosome segregation ATPase
MPRGITQDQVNQAADEILGAGANPTVEKVRAALGTGSPNTITRMLDTWRGQLGERVRQLSALPDVPVAVGKAMMSLWKLATEQAEQAIAGRFAKEHAALEEARGALNMERQALISRLDAAEMERAQAQAARDLAEHACATLDAQLRDSHALRSDLIQQRDRLQAAFDQQIEEGRQLRARLAEQSASLHEERARQDGYVRSLEDRAHLEIDRARQEAKQWQHRLEIAEKSHSGAVSALEAQRASAQDQLRDAEKEIARQAGQIVALEKALTDAQPQAKQKRRRRPASAGGVAKRGQRGQRDGPGRP